MRVRAILVGIVAGLLAGPAIHALLHAPQRPLVEDHGRIELVVIQYNSEAGHLVAPIYAQFLAAAGQELQVVWVVGNRAHLADLKARLAASWPEGRCWAVIVGKEISTWSKDRFVALAPRAGSGEAVLCAPPRRRVPSPLRTNDQEVPYHLALHPSRLFAVRGLDVDFDGGDILATTDYLFAHPAIMEKNSNAPFKSPSAVAECLGHGLARPITWLGNGPQDAPSHHIGMYLTVIGRTAAVGDVRLAEGIAASHPDVLAALQPAGGRQSPGALADLSARLDRTARQMSSLGYRVVRVPLMPAAAPRAWMSYNNGIVETRGARTFFYMPTFGVPAMDAAAAEIFRSQMGCQVIPIDCSAIWPLGGSIHCLVNVVDRTS